MASNPRNWLLGIVALALAVRIPRLWESLWYDELWATSFKLGDVSQILATLHHETSPPLYHLFMALWVRVFGDGEWSVRLVPLVLGVATVPLLFALARRFVADRHALLAAALLALSPVHVWYSTEARPYSAWVFFVVLASAGYERLQAGDARGLRAHVLGAFGASQMHLYGAMFPLVFLGLALLRPALARRRVVLWTNALWLALDAAWLLVQHQLVGVTTELEYLTRFDLHHAGLLFANWLPFGNTLVPGALGDAPTWRQAAFVVLVAAITAVAIRGVARLAWTVAGGKRVLALMALVPVVLLVLPWVGLPSSYIERSALPSLPFFFVVIAAGVAGLPAAVPAGVLAVQALALGLLFAQPDLWTVYKPKPDWRGAAAWLERDAGERVIPAIEALGHDVMRPLAFYSDRIELWIALEPDPEALAPIVRRVRRLLGEDSAIGHGLLGWLNEQHLQIEQRRAERRARVRVPIHRLRQVQLESFLTERRSSGGQSFYVLCRPGAREREPEVQRLLGAEGCTIEAEAGFRSVTIHRVVVR